MEDSMVHQKLDLRGVRCPVNFVKAKLALEEMKKDEILEILLDEGEPIKNVPRSLKEEGHKILHVEDLGGFYRLLVKKV